MPRGTRAPPRQFSPRESGNGFEGQWATPGSSPTPESDGEFLMSEIGDGSSALEPDTQEDSGAPSCRAVVPDEGASADLQAGRTSQDYAGLTTPTDEVKLKSHRSWESLSRTHGSSPERTAPAGDRELGTAAAAATDETPTSTSQHECKAHSEEELDELRAQRNRLSAELAGASAEAESLRAKLARAQTLANDYRQAVLGAHDMELRVLGMHTCQLEAQVTEKLEALRRSGVIVTGVGVLGQPSVAGAVGTGDSSGTSGYPSHVGGSSCRQGRVSPPSRGQVRGPMTPPTAGPPGPMWDRKSATGNRMPHFTASRQVRSPVSLNEAGKRTSNGGQGSSGANSGTSSPPKPPEVRRFAAPPAVPRQIQSASAQVTSNVAANLCTASRRDARSPVNTAAGLRRSHSGSGRRNGQSASHSPAQPRAAHAPSGQVHSRDKSDTQSSAARRASSRRAG